MAEIVDVAEYILKKLGTMSALKLQKLVYYSQAWNLVWEDRPLFDNSIEAWANGPVSPRLYSYHRRMFTVSAGTFTDAPSPLTAKEAVTVDSVVSFYGSRSALELSELTHREDPWRNAREDTPLGARSDAVITTAAMAEYYSSLV